MFFGTPPAFLKVSTASRSRLLRESEKMDSMHGGLEVLLVEDLATDADLACRAISRIGAQIFVARDGAMALDYLYGLGAYSERKGEPRPSLILLDLSLPKVSGLEVLQRVKSDERTKHIPVVVQSSLGEEAYVSESYRLGANSFIVKPSNSDEFVTVFEQVARYWLSLNQHAV